MHKTIELQKRLQESFRAKSITIKTEFYEQTNVEDLQSAETLWTDAVTYFKYSKFQIR